MVESNNLDILKKIEFLNNMEHIEQDFRGHSTALRFICNRGKDKFFLKLYLNNIVDSIEKISRIYSELQIKTANVLELEYIKDINRTCVLYEYIDGNTLKELTKVLEVKELEEIGKKAGKEISKFKRITSDDNSYVNELDKEIEILIIEARNQRDFYENITKSKETMIDLERAIRSLKNLKQYIYKQKPTFIHSDINLNNVIVKEGQPYLIDTDAGKIKFSALDFRGNCWCCWEGNNIERERAIYRGIYKGIFDNNIPAEFHKELAFTMLYEFLLRLTRFPKNIDEIEYTFKRFKIIFNETSYFENYTFNWF